MKKNVSLNFKKLAVAAGILAMLPATVLAAAPGAREFQTSNAYPPGYSKPHPYTFLGGNYFEIGVGETGALNTPYGVPTADVEKLLGSPNYFLMTKSGQKYTLGMRFNKFGFGNGEEATTGEFLKEGSDVWILSYKIDGEQRIIWATDDTNLDEIMPDMFKNDSVSVTTDSDLPNGKLKAKFEGNTIDDVLFEMIYSFGVNDKYFVNDVKVTNNNASHDITDVMFSRWTNVDQDSDLNHHNDTYNKIISNPDSSKAGGEDNYAMAVSRGAITYDGFFFASFDSNTRVSYMTEDETGDVDPENYQLITDLYRTKAGVPTKGTNESMAIMYGDLGVNGHELNETYLTLTAKIGNDGKVTKAGGVAGTRYYTSLDNDVLEGIGDILESRLSVVKTRTNKKIEMKDTTNYDYSIDNGATWVTDGIFDNLDAATKYTIQIRNKSNHNDIEEINVTTKANGKEAVALKVVVVSEDSITVKGDKGYEYSRNGGTTWQTDETFTGLDPDKEYTIVGRLQETYNEMYGETSEPVVVRTQTKQTTALDDVDNVAIDVKIVDEVPTIIINKGFLYEAVKDDTKVKELVESGTDVKIVFDVVKIFPDDKDTPHFDGKTLAFTFDVEIKVYAGPDMEYVKDINEFGKPIQIIVKVPAELIKKGRKFYIVRKHGNDDETAVWSTLKDEDADEDTIMFMNDKFSEFFVVYENTIDNPKTGDNILTYVVMLILGAFGLYLVKTKRFE